MVKKYKHMNDLSFNLRVIIAFISTQDTKLFGEPLHFMLCGIVIRKIEYLGGNWHFLDTN